ncbi:unnamed protein product, partial [Ceratitis capitata]
MFQFFPYGATNNFFPIKREKQSDFHITPTTLNNRVLEENLVDISSQTPHQCDVCGKKYTRKEHLANHMRSHTNDTPFRCEICGKSFSRKEHFTNHILWHT